jgi:hypothetical protein
MADATGHIRVETIIDQSLQAGLNSLSQSIGATTGRITALNSVSRRLSESSRGLNASLKFLGETERGVHSITQALAVSQTTLASHFAQVRREANAFNAVLMSNSSASKANASAISNNIAKIRQMNAAQATLNQTMRAGAMMNMSRQYNKQATELSYVGQRLTMGLTLPLMAVGRIGFTSLKKLDQEMIRTRKLLNDTGTDATVLEGKMKELGDRLDQISFKWGVSRELLQGLAGDFAELGISSPTVLANLVQITNEIEKLGNVDMTEANELTRSIYQNLLKLRRVNDQDVTSDAALKTVTSQVRGAIALFNFAENKTSLSLKDIAQAFPEVQAAATTFGLSMQTTAALLVPMVSAGIKTGTAANALKVSLQKLIIPTKMTRDLYKGLNKELGPNFKTSMDIGTKGIQDLVDSFIELEKSAYGTQGTLQLFARAFGVRQGTRMDLSVQQFAAFQKQIEKTDEAVQTFDGTMGDAFNQNARGSVESQLLSSLEKEINAQLRLEKIEEIRIRNIKEIGDINEMATETRKGKDIYGKEIDVLTKRAEAVQKAQKAMLGDEENQKKISEQINLISTESGKILIGGAIGQGLMEKTMNDELKAVENSLNVQAGKVREAMKSIARDSTVAFGSVLTTVGPALQKIAIFIKNLSPGTKKLIGFFALFLLSIGPLVRVFSLFKQAAGLATFGMAKGMMVGRSRAMELNEELLRVNSTFLKLGRKNTVSEIGGKLVFTGKQKVFNRAQQLSTLQASQAARDPDARGLGARIESSKIKSLERRLGISSKTEANFAGLKPETTSTLKGIYASQASLVDAAKKAAAMAKDFAAQNKPTVVGQMFGNNNPLKGVQVATTKALDLIKNQSLVSPQTILKKAGAGVAAATEKASAKVSVDPFMKTILSAIKSILQEIARCTCAKNPLAAGKPSPTLGAVSSRGSPGPSGNGSANTGATVNPAVAVSAQQNIADEIKRMRDATAAQNARNAAVIANLPTQQSDPSKKPPPLNPLVPQDPRLGVKYQKGIMTIMNPALREALDKIRNATSSVKPVTGRQPLNPLVPQDPRLGVKYKQGNLTVMNPALREALDNIRNPRLSANAVQQPASVKEKAAKLSAEAKPVSVQDRLREKLRPQAYTDIKSMGFEMEKATLGPRAQVGKASFEFGIDQLKGMFERAGKTIPNSLKNIPELLDAEGKRLRLSLNQIVTLFNSISKGTLSTALSQGASGITKQSVASMFGTSVSTRLNADLRRNLGGATRVEAGKATYTDLARVSGRAVDVSGKPRRGYGVRPNPTSLNPPPDQELPLTPVDRGANNRRVPAMMAKFSKVDLDGAPNALYGRIKRQESTVLPGRLEKLENAPVGNKIVTPIDSEGNKLKTRSIPTNVGSASAKDYQKFAAMRANQIQVAKAAALAYKKSQAVVAPKTTELDDPRKGTATGAIPQRNVANTEVGKRVNQAVGRVAKELYEERAAIVKDLKSQGASAKETVTALKQAGLSRKTISRRLSTAEAAARPGAEKEVMTNLGGNLETARANLVEKTKTGPSRTSLVTAKEGLEKDLAPLLAKKTQDEKIKTERDKNESKLAEGRQKLQKLTDSQPARLAEISKIESITAKARTDEQKKLLAALKTQQRELPKARATVAELEARSKVLKEYKSMSAAEKTELKKKGDALKATNKAISEMRSSKGGVGEAQKKVDDAIAAIRKSGLSSAQQERLIGPSAATSASAPKAGGGRVGGTSMVMNPMLGMTGPMLSARAGLVEKFGPKMPTMTTGSTAGSSSTVFDEIQKALKIPGDVMKQVKDNLTKGFTDAQGVARGAQAQVVTVGNASTAEIKGNLDALIKAIKLTGQDANKSVLQITEAIRAARGAFGKIEKATPGLKAQRTGEAAVPAAAATTSTKAINPFDSEKRKATPQQVQQIAGLLTQHNMEVAELQNLDIRTLRKLVETFKNTNESLKKGVSKSSKPVMAQALVTALNDNQKSFITLQEVYTKVLSGDTASINDAKNAVKAASTTPVDPSKVVTAVDGLQRATQSAVANPLTILAQVAQAVNQTGVAVKAVSASPVSPEILVPAVEKMQLAVKSAITNPLAILGQVAQAIAAQQISIPAVSVVTPAAAQVPQAIKLLDNAVIEHVTRLAEQVKNVASGPDMAGMSPARLKRIASVRDRYMRLKPGPEKDAAAQFLQRMGQPIPSATETPSKGAGAPSRGNAGGGAGGRAEGSPRATGPMLQIGTGRVRTSITDIPIPKRGSARSYAIPEPPKIDKLTKLNSFVGKLVAITSRVTSSRAAQVLDGGGAGLMPGLTALKPGLLAPLFQRQNRFIPTDYEGQAKSRMVRALTRRNIDPTTSRQERIIGKEAKREGAAVRGIDRPNELVRMMQGRLPSQFIQSVSPMVDKFRAIGSVFAPRIYKASLMAEMHLKKTAVVGGRVAKEMVKFPLTANVAIGRAAQIVTTALTPSVRTLADSLRSVGTKISGAVQRGFIASGVAESSPKAARVLEIAGKTLSFSVQTAFSMVAGSLSIAAMAIQSPRQALSQGIAGITGVYTRTATAVKGSIAKLAAAGGGGPLGFAKAATMGVAKGAFSLAAKPVKAVGSVIASQVQQSRPYMAMMGGPIVKADDGTASKKGGFFTASKTYDAQGAVTSKSGGFAKNMAAVPFNAIAGGMKMIGGATSMAMGSVSSLANMMLYKLGPAGFLLMPILGKVTAGLQAMGAKALLIVLPLLAIFAVFKVVKKGWESFSKYAGTAAKNFEAVKEVFKTIVDTIKSIFFDFFATLTGANKDASASTPEFGDTKSIAGMKKMGASIEEFSKKLLKFANAFKKIFDKYIAPFIYQVLSGFALVLKGVVDVFMGIFNVVKGIYQKIKGEGDKGTGALKAGWEKLKSGVLLVLKGILKMFIGILIPIVNAVFKFVELVVQLFEFLGFAIVNIMRYIAKTIISVVTGFVSVFAFVIDKIIEVWVFLETSVVVIFRELLKVGVNVGAGILKGFIWAIQKILDAFGGLLVGVGDILGYLPMLIGAVFQSIADKAKDIPLVGGLLAAPVEAIAKGFDFIAGGLDTITNKAKSGLNGLLDPVSEGIDAGAAAITGTIDDVADKATKAISAIGKIGDILRNKIADFGDAARDGVDKVADKTNAIIGSASDLINESRKFITDWLQSFAKGDDIIEGMGQGAKDALNDAIKNTDPSALAAAGEDIAKAIQEGLKNVKMNFFEKVIDNLGKALEKQKTKLADALNLQKDNQLKIFDDQIAAIDALAAAEEKLTATIEFENKKREAEAERALQRKNYEKQRALAIYEGRIDDARTLDQEETKNRKDAEKNLQDMQTERNKTLQGEQRDTAKTIIGQQKTKAAEAFDKDIKAFEEFAANVLSKGTFTQAELESQFAEISNKASEMSLDMRDSFATFYTALPGLISANTNSTVGFFNTGLQTLVDAAKAKFGLDAEVNADSILGSTALMLNGSTAMFAEKMPLVLAEYKKGTDALAQVGIEWATPGNPNSPESIYGKAIADANAAMLREFMKMKTEAGSAFAEVVKEINAQIKDIAIADAIKAATEGLKKVGTGSDTGTGTETPVSTIGSALDNTTYSYPKTAAELGLNPTQTTLYNDAMSGVALGSGGNNPFGTVSAAYMDQFNGASPGSPAKNKSLAAFKDQIKPKKFFELNDTGSLITTIKQALRFYGYNTGNTDPKLGQAAVTAVSQFQEKYNISPVDGRVRENTARALGLFSDPGTPKRYYGGAIKRMMGGPVGAYGAGGTVPGFAMKAVPALLHGGEYVINSKAVQNLGSGFLQYINSLKNGMPKFGIPKPNMPSVNINQTVNVNGGNSENINNYNFYVDNFIGEDKWFEGMMNEYNVKVVPNKQKSAGLESRVIRSYNGINKGI